MPTTVLRDLAVDEYEEWRSRCVQSIASDIQAVTGDAVSAVLHAEADVAASLPSGLETPANRVFRVMGNEVPVGWLWLALTSPRAEPDLGWLYHVLIDEEHRRQGYGRSAILRAEDVGRREGLASMGLNVFSQNHVAYALYVGLGYTTVAKQDGVSLIMRKSL